MKVHKSTVSAKPRQLKATWAMETQHELSVAYGAGVEAQWMSVVWHCPIQASPPTRWVMCDLDALEFHVMPDTMMRAAAALNGMTPLLGSDEYDHEVWLVALRNDHDDRE